MESASALDSFNGTVTGASSGRGEGRKIKHALLARERVEQVDDFAGRAKVRVGYTLMWNCFRYKPTILSVHTASRRLTAPGPRTLSVVFSMP